MMNIDNLRENAENAMRGFYTCKMKSDAMQDELSARKEKFYEAMSEYFDAAGITKVEFGDRLDSGAFAVKKVEKTSIIWDADRLEKRVEKHVAKQIIKKQYHISDMPGLVAYLKLCGVNPKVFKKFIMVEKSVDDKAVDRLGDIGEISVAQINGCYRVETQKPYYTVKKVKGKPDE